MSKLISFLKKAGMLFDANTKLFGLTEIPEYELVQNISVSKEEYNIGKENFEYIQNVINSVKDEEIKSLNVPLDQQAEAVINNLFAYNLTHLSNLIQGELYFYYLNTIDTLNNDNDILNNVTSLIELKKLKQERYNSAIQELEFILYHDNFERKREIIYTINNSLKEINAYKFLNTITYTYAKIKYEETFESSREIFEKVKESTNPIEEVLNICPELRKLYSMQKQGYISSEINLNEIIEESIYSQNIPNRKITDKDNNLLGNIIFNTVMSKMPPSFYTVYREIGSFSLNTIADKFAEEIIRRLKSLEINIDDKIIKQVCLTVLSVNKPFQSLDELINRNSDEIAEKISFLVGRNSLNVESLKKLALGDYDVYVTNTNEIGYYEKYYLAGKYFSNDYPTSLKKLNEFFDFIHNEFNVLSKEETIALLENPNVKNINLQIVKDLLALTEHFKNLDSFAIQIDKAIDKGILEKEFYKNVEFIKDAIKEKHIINPSSISGRKLVETIKRVSSDVEFIHNYTEYEEHYETAKESPKNENLFKLNLDINQRLRFRVLKDLDFNYFTVGKETDCCQRLGGAGEAAAIDSFINPLAGVLVLEYLNDDGIWDIASQSYFHYVPKDNGIILDNIESSPRYRNGIRDYSLEDIYAYWANHFKNNFNYIQCGLDYNKISGENFGTITMRNDRREFAVEEPYSDWDPQDQNIDLTTYKAPIKDITKMSMIDKIVVNITKLANML